VSPRVLGFLVQASLCEDELFAEYYGGVLASARGPSGRDDRGASMMSLIGRLSTYQVRFANPFRPSPDPGETR
jgi:hypothetical protein